MLLDFRLTLQGLLNYASSVGITDQCRDLIPDRAFPDKRCKRLDVRAQGVFFCQVKSKVKRAVMVMVSINMISCLLH